MTESETRLQIRIKSLEDRLVRANLALKKLKPLVSNSDYGKAWGEADSQTLQDHPEAITERQNIHVVD